MDDGNEPPSCIPSLEISDEKQFQQIVRGLSYTELTFTESAGW